MFDVLAEAHHYEEMNVDGGLVAQVFLYATDHGRGVDPTSAELARERHACINRNSSVDPDRASVNRRFLSISGRAISIVTASTTALAYIEPDFPNVKHKKFDTAYIKALFASGYRKGTERIFTARGAAEPRGCAAGWSTIVTV